MTFFCSFTLAAGKLGSFQMVWRTYQMFQYWKDSPSFEEHIIQMFLLQRDIPSFGGHTVQMILFCCDSPYFEGYTIQMFLLQWDGPSFGGPENEVCFKIATIPKQ